LFPISYETISKFNYVNFNVIVLNIFQIIDQTKLENEFRFT
jgi:hypothetical protein